MCYFLHILLQADLTFFTNEPGATLLDRFRKTLKDLRYFVILVGFNSGRKAFEIIETSRKFGRVGTTHRMRDIEELGKRFRRNVEG